MNIGGSEVIKTKQLKRRLLPQALLTPEEVKKIVKAAEDRRDGNRCLWFTGLDA